MTRLRWALITSIVIIVYGVLLIFQAVWPGWTVVQSGAGLNIAKIVGGVALICWAATFLRIK